VALFRIVFLFFVLSLIYLGQRFWFVTAWRRVDALARPAWKTPLHAFVLAVAAVVVATFCDPMLGHFIPRHDPGKWMIAGTRIWLVASTFAFLAVTAVGLVERLSRPATRVMTSKNRERFDPTRRALFRCAAGLAGSAPFVATLYGFGKERLRYRVEEVEVPVAALPKALAGLRIVQLSDIHIGDFLPRPEVRRAVEIANGLSPDLAVLTGDLISDRNDPLEDCIAELSRLRAPLGIWGCNGNHEIYGDAEDRAQDLFRRYGMRLLRQEGAEVEWRGGHFNLIGVDFQRGRTPFGERLPMLPGVESLVRKDIPNILLSHNPNSFPRAAELGIELSLAGHTHGGQIRLEVVDHDWSAARFLTDFVAGLYRLPLGQANAGQQFPRSASLYVNRGLGTFGIPVRLGVPPEITLLTLRAG
jgi:hypothetical protein